MGSSVILGGPSYRSPKHILLTGASRGLGEALAKRYAKKDVILELIARNEESLQRVATACMALGASAFVHICDIIDSDRMNAAFLNAASRGPLDLVICNAGTTGDGLGLADFPSLLHAVLQTNVNGTLKTVTLAVEGMVGRGGQIAVVGSMSAAHKLPKAAKIAGEVLIEFTPYVISKASLVLAVKVSNFSSYEA